MSEFKRWTKSPLIPAQAGIHGYLDMSLTNEIPAFAGMSGDK